MFNTTSSQGLIKIIQNRIFHTITDFMRAEEQAVLYPNSRNYLHDEAFTRSLHAYGADNSSIARLRKLTEERAQLQLKLFRLVGPELQDCQEEYQKIEQHFTNLATGDISVENFITAIVKIKPELGELNDLRDTVTAYKAAVDAHADLAITLSHSLSQAEAEIIKNQPIYSIEQGDVVHKERHK